MLAQCKTSKSESLIWAIFIIIGTIFVSIGIVICLNVFNYENKVETVGVITQISSYKDSEDARKYNVYVSYNINGEEYESKLNGYSSSFYEGKEIDIYYDKDNPNEIGAKSLDLLCLIFPAIGMIFVIIGLIGLVIKIKKKKLEKFLRENGEVVYANYIETVLNTKYRVNGRYPYNIVCDWNNPRDGKKYIFKSNNIWVNPENIILERDIKIFPVYINLENAKQYFVDVECLTEKQCL